VISDFFFSEFTKPESFTTSVSLAMPLLTSSLRFGLVVKYSFVANYVTQHRSTVSKHCLQHFANHLIRNLHCLYVNNEKFAVLMMVSKRNIFSISTIHTLPKGTRYGCEKTNYYIYTPRIQTVKFILLTDH